MRLLRVRAPHHPSSSVLLALALCAAACDAPPTETEPSTPSTSSGDDVERAGPPLEENGEPTDEVAVYGVAAEPAAADEPPPVAPAPEPAARTPAPRLAREPALTAGDAEYQRAMAISLDVGTQPTVAALSELLVARLRERIAAIGAARDSYRAAATTPPLRALAAIRVGDLWDALGAELMSVAPPVPTEISRMLTGEPAELRAEVRDAVQTRLREALAPHATDAFCEALASYRSALEEGNESPRPTSQIEAYGADLSAYCVSRPAS